MAAALLMMNMQGAVMAADKDLTIFRYSDKVPFALMTDPKSRLKWDEIWDNFRSMASINEEDTFDQRVTVFDNFLSKYLHEIIIGLSIIGDWKHDFRVRHPVRVEFV